MLTMFPEYLGPGSKGRSVTILHILLSAMGLDEGLIFDGKYGEVTTARVKDLQMILWEIDPESDELDWGTVVDGCFGPKTRAQLEERFFCLNDYGHEPHLAVRRIPNINPELFLDATHWVDPERGDGIWPPEEGADTSSGGGDLTI